MAGPFEGFMKNKQIKQLIQTTTYRRIWPLGMLACHFMQPPIRRETWIGLSCLSGASRVCG